MEKKHVSEIVEEPIPEESVEEFTEETPDEELAEESAKVDCKVVTEEDSTVKYLPRTTNIKTWMPYKKSSGKSIFHSQSKQYALQQLCYTGDYGVRMFEGRYCVALGSYFSVDIGQYFDLILDNGVILPCVLSDSKADVHTDSMNIFTVASNCMSEFVVDREVLNSTGKQLGNMSKVCDEWNSPVVAVRLYNENAFEKEVE